jgi:hypothetical protein
MQGRCRVDLLSKAMVFVVVTGVAANISTSAEAGSGEGNLDTGVVEGDLYAHATLCSTLHLQHM